MPQTRSQLASALTNLGLRPDDVVMVHASVRAVGPVFGGPDQIHLAIEDVVGPGGAMMMYVGCELGFDDVGRGFLSAETEADLLAHLPAFDFQTARANRDFGALAELFRSWPGTVCSEAVGPRMAARGGKATWITAGAPWNYGFGRGSPLEKLCEADGRVLLLGSDPDEVTLLHLAEHIGEFPKTVTRYRTPIMRDGERVWIACEEFNSGDGGVNPNWPDEFFAEIVEDFIECHDGTALCRRGKVGNADSVLLNAAKLVEHAVPIMVRQATGT
jgi:aminoglycoside 3-N-acetyltransferase